MTCGQDRDQLDTLQFTHTLGTINCSSDTNMDTLTQTAGWAHCLTHTKKL